MAQPEAKNGSVIKSAVWAINPFEFDSIAEKSAFEQIKSYLGGTYENLWPIFICGPSQLENWKQNEQVEKTRQFLKSMGIRDLEMVPEDSDRQRDLADELQDRASAKKAEVILLTSRGHSRLSSFFLGSFAEQLLLTSHLPLLFMNKKSAEPFHSRKALFASDFSDHSKKVYHHFLKQMGSRLDELILYHAISLPVDVLSASAYSGTPAILTESEIEEQVNQAQSLCESWMNEARMNHLKVRFQAKIDHSVGAIGQAILKVAESEEVGIIAMASHSGPLTEMFLGSVTRDVFEVATYPVWVCGPHF